MSIAFAQVDAFTVDDRPFTGNPAAVMPLDQWLDDATLLAIAAENNLSETAFLVPCDDDEADYHLRWFTPTTEVPLCGHATFASAHIVLGDLPQVRFLTKSGILTVTRDGDGMKMDLPMARLSEGRDAKLAACLGMPSDTPIYLQDGKSRIALIEMPSEERVRNLKPDLVVMSRIERLVIITARGSSHDFISRVFSPFDGIDEDPVTGAAHTGLVPYWSRLLGKTRLRAYQASQRGGDLICELAGDRVFLSGRCRTVITGQFQA